MTGRQPPASVAGNFRAHFGETAAEFGGADDPWHSALRDQFVRTLAVPTDARHVQNAGPLAARYARLLTGPLAVPENALESFLHDLLAATEIRDVGDLLTRAEAIDCMPGYPELHNFDAQEFCDYLVKSVTLGQAARAAGCPIMPVFSYPKTGSSFVTGVMGEIMDCHYGIASLAHLTAIPAWASFIGRFPISLHDHMFPTAHNVARLANAGVTKLVLLLRDPRQVVVSLAHHLVREARGPVSSNREQVFMDLLEDVVATHPRLYRNWYVGWMEATRSRGIQVLIVKFEDLTADSARCFHQILEFFEAPAYLHARVGPVVEKATAAFARGGFNARKGRADEWRNTLTFEQRRAIDADIGSAFLPTYALTAEPS